jgi:hypothetical protein
MEQKAVLDTKSSQNGFFTEGYVELIFTKFTYRYLFYDKYDK